MALPGEPSARSRPWTLWLRIGISAALLVFLLSRIHPTEILPEDRDGSTLVWIGIGLTVTFLGIVLSAWRWQRVLVVLGAPVRLAILVSHYLAGQFVGNVLPSTIGGDVLRIARVGRSTGSQEVGFTSVALERLTGFVALPLLCYLGFAADPAIITWKRSYLAIAIATGALVALLVILWMAAHPRLAGRFAERENWTRFIGAVHDGVTQFRGDPVATLGAFGAAVVYQVSVVLAVMCAAKALHLSIPTAVFFAYVPAVAMAQVVPLTLGGLGVREGLLVLFLAPFGVERGQAIALGLLWYGMLLVVSLLGAPSFAVGHRHRPEVGMRGGERAGEHP